MANDSIWVIDTNPIPSSRPILDYIIKQGEDLKNATNGRVKGILDFAGGSFVDSISLLRNLTLPAYSPTQHKDMKDASELYKKRTYEFFIIDNMHNYELSVFKITCNDSLPVSLSIDPTIASESGIPQQVDVNNLKAFQQYFSKIVATQKVRYIIMKLIEMQEKENSQLIEAESDQSPKSILNEENDNE